MSSNSVCNHTCDKQVGLPLFNYLWILLPSNHCHCNTWHASKTSQTDNVIKCYLCKFQRDTLIGSRDIAVKWKNRKLAYHSFLHCVRFSWVCYGIKSFSDPWLRVLSFVVRNSPPRFVNSQLVAFCQFLILLRRYEGALAYMHGPTSSA